MKLHRPGTFRIEPRQDVIDGAIAFIGRNTHVAMIDPHQIVRMIEAEFPGISPIEMERALAAAVMIMDTILITNPEALVTPRIRLNRHLRRKAARS